MIARLDRWMLRLKPRPFVQWGVIGVLSLAFLIVLEALHLPAALLLAPMIAGILFSAAGGTVRVPEFFYAGAQGVVGCMIARSLPLSNLGEAAGNWPVFAAGVGSTVVVAAMLGWLLTRWRVLPGTTAIWGSSPGAASTMVVMAEAFGADVRLVAFMQYLRVMCVAGMASVVASLAMTGAGHRLPPIDWLPPLHLGPLAITLAIAFTGAFLGKVLRVPAGALMVPLIATSVLGWSGAVTIELPPWLLAMSYALFGWSIGLRFTREIFLHAARATPRLLAAIAALIAICGGFGMVLSRLAGIDPLTAYLATSPGGADSVAIIAASSHVDVPFVMTMQMVRFVVVLATGPALARFLAGKAEP
jgi:membrane AbrB-like protein